MGEKHKALLYYLPLIEFRRQLHICPEPEEHILHIPYWSQRENCTADTIDIIHLALLSGQWNTIKASVFISLSHSVSHTHT